MRPLTEWFRSAVFLHTAPHRVKAAKGSLLCGRTILGMKDSLEKVVAVTCKKRYIKQPTDGCIAAGTAVIYSLLDCYATVLRSVTEACCFNIARSSAALDRVIR